MWWLLFLLIILIVSIIFLAFSGTGNDVQEEDRLEVDYADWVFRFYNPTKKVLPVEIRVYSPAEELLLVQEEDLLPENVFAWIIYEALPYQETFILRYNVKNQSIKDLVFDTPDQDAFAMGLNVSRDKYLKARVGDWVSITPEEYYEGIPPHLTYSVPRGNLPFHPNLGNIPRKAIGYSDRTAIENGNVVYGLSFIAGETISGPRSFQVLYIPLESTSLTDVYASYTVTLKEDLDKDQSYNYILKGADIFTWDSSNFTRPIFWPFPNLPPFAVQEALPAYLSEENVDEEYTNQTFSLQERNEPATCYTFNITNERRWYPYDWS